MKTKLELPQQAGLAILKKLKADTDYAISVLTEQISVLRRMRMEVVDAIAEVGKLPKNEMVSFRPRPRKKN